jgi:aspartate aminotransferase
MANRLALSERAKQMPASPIRRLAPYADRAKERGVKVYHLNIGQPDIETPVEMLRGYHEFTAKTLAYGPSGGLPSYVRALVEYYRRVGISVEPKDILVTTGGSEAILFALQAVADTGEEIIVPEPFYTNYAGFAAMSGVSLVPVTCRAEDGFALPPYDDFVAAISPRTRAILYSNPGNPTGVVYTAEELERLRRLCIERNIYLIADEVYREFIYDDRPHLSALNLEGMSDHAIMVDSISKRYSACGARVGCVVTRNAQLIAAMLKFAQARLCPPTVDQLAAEAALAVPDSYIEKVIAEYRCRRDVVVESLNRVPGVICRKPNGAFYVVAKLPIDDAEKFAIFLLDGFNKDNETVMVAPADGFYATPGKGRDEIRIAYVLNCDDLDRAMRLLERGLAAYRETIGAR